MVLTHSVQFVNEMPSGNCIWGRMWASRAGLMKVLCFYRILKSVVIQDEQEKPSRWEKSIQDCLRVVYDLR